MCAHLTPHGGSFWLPMRWLCQTLASLAFLLMHNRRLDFPGRFDLAAIVSCDFYITCLFCHALFGIRTGSAASQCSLRAMLYGFHCWDRLIRFLQTMFTFPTASAVLSSWPRSMPCGHRQSKTLLLIYRRHCILHTTLGPFSSSFTSLCSSHPDDLRSSSPGSGMYDSKSRFYK